jgi:hypothetical protein
MIHHQLYAHTPRAGEDSAFGSVPRSALRIPKSGRLSEIGICIIRNSMTATAALDKQIERYRSMTGIPRTTHDLDFVVQFPATAVPLIFQEFNGDFLH